MRVQQDDLLMLRVKHTSEGQVERSRSKGALEAKLDKKNNLEPS